MMNMNTKKGLEHFKWIIKGFLRFVAHSKESIFFMSLIDKMKKVGNPEFHFTEIKLLQLFLKNHVTLMEKGWFLYINIYIYICLL